MFWSLTALNGPPLSVCSTKNTKDGSTGNVRRLLPRIANIVFLQLSTSFSQILSTCGDPIKLNFGTIRSQASLAHSVLIAFLDTFSKFTCSCNKVSSIIIKDYGRSTAPSHECGDCHHASNSVQAFHHFFVKCSSDQTNKQALPVLNWLTPNSDDKRS